MKRNEIDWRRVRSHFPITSAWTYLNHASMGPAPIQLAEKIRELYEARLTRDVTEEHDLDCNEEVRKKVARLIGAVPEEIAFCGNTSEGIIRAVDAIPFDPGDNVVIPDQEFPANVYPWLSLRRRGVQIRFVSVPRDWYRLEYLQKACDNRTKVVAVSWVNFMNGFRVDLRNLFEFCQDRGILLCVDGMQGVGSMHLDLKETPVDMLAFHTVKWLCGPFGVGVFYCSRRVQKTLKSGLLGWRSVQRQGLEDLLDHNLPAFETARRFEWGSPNATAISAFGATLDLFLTIGTKAIQERILSFGEVLSRGLTQRGLEVTSCLENQHRSGISTFALDHADEFVRACREQRIAVALRRGTVRLSPHFYNNEEDLNRFLDFLDSWRMS